MAKNTTIGICVTSIHRPSIHRTLRALATEARKRGYYLQIFAPLSDLYQKTKDDAAQKRIYNFVDFNKNMLSYIIYRNDKGCTSQERTLYACNVC